MIEVLTRAPWVSQLLSRLRSVLSLPQQDTDVLAWRLATIRRVARPRSTRRA